MKEREVVTVHQDQDKSANYPIPLFLLLLLRKRTEIGDGCFKPPACGFKYRDDSKALRVLLGDTVDNRRRRVGGLYQVSCASKEGVLPTLKAVLLYVVALL